MKKIDEKELTRIEALAKKAPKGPWVVWKGTYCVEQGPAEENTRGTFRGPKGGGQICEVDDFDNKKPRASVNFIAASRSDVPALCAAVRERDAEIAALVKAARKVVNLGWDHGEDCPHRDCDDPDNCSDGCHASDGCESFGTPCDCHVADRDALAALLPAVPS